MNWLAAPESQEPDPSVPTRDIVERFLRWVTEPAWRQVAVVAALPRSFNVDILKRLLEYREQTVDEQSSCAWLLTMPFVKQHADGWHYHDVVRHMILHYQCQESPQTYRRAQLTLAGFYNLWCDELGLTENEHWTNEQWRADTLAYAYHFLVADPIKHWGEVVSLFVVAVRKLSNDRLNGSYTLLVKLDCPHYINRSFYIKKNTLVEGSYEEDEGVCSARLTRGTGDHSNRNDRCGFHSYRSFYPATPLLSIVWHANTTVS